MKSTIALPTDYVIVDVETTGRNPQYDKIIEIGAICYRNCQEVARFHQLVSIDRHIPRAITMLTGITNEMLAGKPAICDAIQAFSEFLGSDILLGHNIASFDSSFIGAAYTQYIGKELTNPCVDTLRITKKIFPEFGSHTLETLALHYGISYQGAHRSIVDCSITNDCYMKMRNEILQKYSEADFKKLFEKKKSSGKSYWQYQRIDIKTIKPSCDCANTESPLCGKSIVFTGTLSIPREDAMQMAVDAGAVLKTSVSPKTDYLVVGAQDLSVVGEDGMSSKEEKAHMLNDSGKANISIINEREFIELVNKEGASV